MIFGLALALGSALGTNFAFLLKQRGAVAAPRVDGRHPVRSAVDLFRSRWWTVGWLVALGAWGLHVGALSLAPLSLVQAVMSGGLVFLAVLAERVFGFHLGRRQWLGVTVTAVGLAVLGLTRGHVAGETGRYSLAGLIAVESAVFVIAGLLVVTSAHGGRFRHREGMLLGGGAGALFGVSDIAIKYLAHRVPSDVLALLSPWTLAALVAAVVAFYASARGLQVGPAVEVIVLTSVAANIAAIVGGILVFQESIGEAPLAIVARVAAFSLVIVGGALMPGPVRVRGQPSPTGTRHPDPISVSRSPGVAE